MKHDFFKLAQDKVAQIMTNHKINIDFADDDTFSDFVSIIDDYNFSTSEKQYIYTYNSMLQTIAFSVADIEFIMEIKQY